MSIKDLDDIFLRDTLTQLWAGADDNPKLWSGDVPKAAEAVEWTPGLQIPWWGCFTGFVWMLAAI